MVGPHHADFESVLKRGAAEVHGVDRFHALRVEPHADFIVGDDFGTGRTSDLNRVSDMIAVAMGEKDV